MKSRFLLLAKTLESWTQTQNISVHYHHDTCFILFYFFIDFSKPGGNKAEKSVPVPANNLIFQYLQLCNYKFI